MSKENPTARELHVMARAKGRHERLQIAKAKAEARLADAPAGNKAVLERRINDLANQMELCEAVAKVGGAEAEGKPGARRISVPAAHLKLRGN